MAARTTTKTAAAEPEYDFDNWSEADEEKALAALAPQIKYIIVEKTFVGRFEDGVIVKLPLSISLDDIDQLTDDFQNPVDQVKELLKTMGGEESVKEFTRHNMTETIAMAEKFFSVFSRIAGASVPES
jgi:hypothetical protein